MLGPEELVLLFVLLGGVGTLLVSSMLSVVVADPPDCAAPLTQSSSKGFCSGLVLQWKQRSSDSNLAAAQRYIQEANRRQTAALQSVSDTCTAYSST